MNSHQLPEVANAYAGVKLIASGEVETGFGLLRESAEKGVLYAWQCLTWNYLRREEFVKSISFFEQNFYTIKDWSRTNEDFVERRLDIIKNYVAIAYFALEKKDKSLKLWGESLSSLSVESRFYSIIASQSDEKLILNKIYEEFGINELEKLSAILKNIASKKGVWFKQFNQKFLPLINQSIEERNKNILRLSENHGKWSNPSRNILITTFGLILIFTNIRLYLRFIAYLSRRRTIGEVTLTGEDDNFLYSYIHFFDDNEYETEIKRGIAAEKGEATS